MCVNDSDIGLYHFGSSRKAMGAPLVIDGLDFELDDGIEHNSL